MSSDTLEDSKALTERLTLTIPLLSDPERTIIKAFGLDDPANEISWPAIYIIAPDGTIAWRDFLETYKERTPVDEILAALDQLGT